MSFGEHGGFLRGLDRWLEREDDDRDRSDFLIATCDECGTAFVVKDDDEAVLCERCTARAQVSPTETWERR